jgi:peptidoglycan/LPS O-acetylase OafA/YrhL
LAPMGISLWMACAAAVFLAIRRVPFGRPASWMAELFAMLISALVLGALATALDFGGWNEPDWRAALFVLFGSAAIAGAVRLIRFEPSEQQ